MLRASYYTLLYVYDIPLFTLEALHRVEFIRKYNDNIMCSIYMYCGLFSTGTSRMENAKYNAHGQAKYHIDGRFTLVMCVLVLYVIIFICVLPFRQREL